MKIRIFVALGVALMDVAPATAQTIQQKNALRHLADATFIAGQCPTLQLNAAAVRLIVAGYKLGDFTDPMTANGREFIRAFGRADSDGTGLKGNTDAACAAGLLMFGPTGGNVRDLLTRQ